MATAYPQPTFHFNIQIGGKELLCSEVSGMDVEFDEMTYRYGSSPDFTLTKMTGMRKSSDITVKKGVFKGDKEIWTWLEKTKMNVPDRQPVTINLLDEEQKPVMTWELANAWPKKFTSPTLKADSSEVGIEEMVIAHEGCKLAGGA